MQDYAALLSNAQLSKAVKSSDILYDLMKLIEEYYVGSFECTNKFINLAFNNGQKFIISIEEMHK